MRAKLVNCTFYRNWADNHGTVNDHGGATLNLCAFRENHSDDFAAGLYVHNNIETTVMTCEFYDNTAVSKGGGAYVLPTTTGPDPTFTDCIFSGNQAFHGGGMYNNGSNPTITNCTFSNNISNGGGAGSGSGGGMYNAASSPTVSDCTFIGNETTGSGGCGGAMTNTGSSPILTNCKFFDNSATYGAGMYNQEDDQDPNNPLQSSPTVINCIFSGNDAESKGGGMFPSHASATTLTNCTFSGNTAVTDGGGGIEMDFTSTLTATNCTFSGNSAGTLGGGVRVSGCVGGPTFTTNNSVFWGNSDNGGMDESAQIYFEGTTPPDVTYSDLMNLVQGGPFCELCGDTPQVCCNSGIANGNIGVLPMFVDSLSGTSWTEDGVYCSQACWDDELCTVCGECHGAFSF